ncbi:hypothetical protein GCM10009712_08380 [Pseudarthrobacter sulfonivorans]
MGKPGGLASEVGSAKYFGIGAILMVLAGAAPVIDSLITGQPGRATGPGNRAGQPGRATGPGNRAGQPGRATGPGN